MPTLLPTLKFDVLIPPTTVTTFEVVSLIERFAPDVISLSDTITFVATKLPLTVMRSRPVKSIATFVVSPLLT